MFRSDLFCLADCICYQIIAECSTQLGKPGMPAFWQLEGKQVNLPCYKCQEVVAEILFLGDGKDCCHVYCRLIWGHSQHFLILTSPGCELMEGKKLLQAWWLYLLFWLFNRWLSNWSYHLPVGQQILSIIVNEKNIHKTWFILLLSTPISYIAVYCSALPPVLTGSSRGMVKCWSV